RDVAYDAAAGAHARPDPAPVPVAELHRHLQRGTDLPVRLEHLRVCGDGDARRDRLVGTGGVRAVRDQVAWPAGRLPARDLDDDAAGSGDDRAAVPRL